MPYIYHMRLVCLSMKAYHLELVSELTADAFIATFTRCTERRGMVQALYSDKGTNFIGSNRQLKLLHQHSQRNTNPGIAALFTQVGTLLEPNSWPHHTSKASGRRKWNKLNIIFGEILAKRRTFLTIEKLSTLLCQIEACLNSRPLCPMPDDPDGCIILTPVTFWSKNRHL